MYIAERLGLSFIGALPFHCNLNIDEVLSLPFQDVHNVKSCAGAQTRQKELHGTHALVIATAIEYYAVSMRVDTFKPQATIGTVNVYLHLHGLKVHKTSGVKALARRDKPIGSKPATGHRRTRGKVGGAHFGQECYICPKDLHMKLSLDLEYQTPPEWAVQALDDFDAFLQDHADCERKASSMAMSFVAKCPDKVEIIPELIDTALEELEHFQMVYRLMEQRGVKLAAQMPKDTYIHQLMALCRSGVDERLMDRMLLASIIECRGAERFKLIADAAAEPEVKTFYKKLWTSEAKHGHIFVKFALNYWPKEAVYDRLEALNKAEGEICAKLAWRPALH